MTADDDVFNMLHCGVEEITSFFILTPLPFEWSNGCSFHENSKLEIFQGQKERLTSKFLISHLAMALEVLGNQSFRSLQMRNYDMKLNSKVLKRYVKKGFLLVKRE